jgi:hypothetical protein
MCMQCGRASRHAVDANSALMKTGGFALNFEGAGAGAQDGVHLGRPGT